MRVIAGVYRSRVLGAPRGLATRPTTDRLRETLFNVLAPRMAGCTFADLFAGSGANGIEALSRGARHVYFVENGAAALAAIRGNLRTLGIGAGFEIDARTVALFLRSHRDTTKDGVAQQLEIDMALLDPPYEDGEAYALTLGLLGGECASVLASDAIVIAEHLHKRPLQESYGNLNRYRVLKQGDAALSFYKMSALESVD